MKLKLEDYKRIAERMFAEVADNARNFGPEDTDYEWLFEKHFDAVFAWDLCTDEVYERHYMKAYNSPVIQECFEEIRTYILDFWNDVCSYNASPMKYYGLKQSDFI